MVLLPIGCQVVIQAYMQLLRTYITRYTIQLLAHGKTETPTTAFQLTFRTYKLQMALSFIQQTLLVVNVATPVVGQVRKRPPWRALMSAI